MSTYWGEESGSAGTEVSACCFAGIYSSATLNPQVPQNLAFSSSLLPQFEQNIKLHMILPIYNFFLHGRERLSKAILQLNNIGFPTVIPLNDAISNQSVNLAFDKSCP